MQLHIARASRSTSRIEQEFLVVYIETVPFELVLNMLETGDGLVGALHYNTDLFDAATIIRMAGRFQLLLDKVVAEPDIKLNEIVEMVAESERQPPAFVRKSSNMSGGPK